jgi:MFS family permease
MPTADEHKNEQLKPPLWTRSFISVFLANFFLFFGFGMLPTLLPLHFQLLGAPLGLLGAVAIVYTLATILMRPFVGVAIDRFGRRGLLSAGLIIMALASVAYFVFPIVSAVLLIRFIQGIGWAMANTASPTTAADAIPRARFAEGMSWFGWGNSLASVFAPALSLSLFYRVGANLSVLISAGVFAIALLLAQGVRYRKLEKPAAAPAAAPFALSSLIERRSVKPALIMFFVTACFGAVATFLPQLTSFRNIDGVQYYFPMEALAMLVTRPFLGRFVDKVGLMKPGTFGLATMCCSMSLMFFAFNLPALLLAAALQGVGYSFCYTTYQTMAVADIETERRGSATATFYVGFDGGMGFGAFVAGGIAATFGIGTVFIIYAALPIIGILILWLVQPLNKNVP